METYKHGLEEDKSGHYRSRVENSGINNKKSLLLLAETYKHGVVEDEVGLHALAERNMPGSVTKSLLLMVETCEHGALETMQVPTVVERNFLGLVTK